MFDPDISPFQALIVYSNFITVNYFYILHILIIMTLPELCPLDESQACKGRECHLFCLEWRTREPTCLIGYNTTSKVRSNKADRKKDTYAEDTFRKLGKQQPLPKWKNVSEKGDWMPTRPVEIPPERPAERKEEKKFLTLHERIPRNCSLDAAKKSGRQEPKRPLKKISITGRKENRLPVRLRKHP